MDMYNEREGLKAALEIGDYSDEWGVGGYDDTFTCPCGIDIELDGECPSGHVSPLREMGLI